MKEFKINNYITLKLEDGKTIIYLNDKRFQQCKYLLLNIHINEISYFNEIESIDEAAEKLDKSLEAVDDQLDELPPEVEFWGHCSNLQVWAEENYDTRLLHSNLAFPLLKKLTEVGVPNAKIRFKEEIIKRLSTNYPPVILYLGDDDFLEVLADEDWEVILSDNGLNIARNLIISLPLIFRYDELLADYLVEKIKKYMNKRDVFDCVRNQIYELLKYGSDDVFIEIICYEFYKYLNEHIMRDIFEDPNSMLIKNIEKVLDYKTGKNGKNLDYIFKSIAFFLKAIKEKNEALNLNNILNENIKLKSIFDIM